MLTGKSVEGLRRTEEIGKGIVQEPGSFYTIFTAILLIGTSYFKKHRVIWIHPILIILLIGILFLITGHKAPAVGIIILSLGVYIKRNTISPLFIFSGFIILFLILGFFNILRAQHGIESIFLIIKAPIISSTGIYLSNYSGVIRLIDTGILGLQMGREYFQNALLIIPRFLYQEKPKIGSEYIILYPNIISKSQVTSHNSSFSS